MRIHAGEDLARHSQALFQDDLVADAVVADVVEMLDAVLADEGARLLVADGILDRRRGRRVVHHHGDAVRVEHLQQLRFPVRCEGQVQQDHAVDVTDHDVASPYLRAARCARKNLLDDGHAHAFSFCVFVGMRGAGRVRSFLPVSGAINRVRPACDPAIGCIFAGRPRAGRPLPRHGSGRSRRRCGGRPADGS